MNILITGSKGQLGKELLTRAGEKTSQVLGVDLPELDITHEAQVTRMFNQFKPSVIINAAAYTNVDQAEDDQETAFSVNQNGPFILGEYCQIKGIPLIHISTDYVFDGSKETPYTEKDPISPMGIYGQSKAHGEIKIRSVLKEYIIIRTSWLYSAHGHNFLNTMLKLGREKEEINVVSDQYGSPTCAADLAETILHIVEHMKKDDRPFWGTYHYAGDGITSWHGFAEAIFDLAQIHIDLKIDKVLPITTAEYPTRARRPAYSVLDCGLIQKTFNIRLKPWEKSLEKTINTLFSNI